MAVARRGWACALTFASACFGEPPEVENASTSGSGSTTAVESSSSAGSSGGSESSGSTADCCGIRVCGPMQQDLTCEGLPCCLTGVPHLCDMPDGCDTPPCPGTLVPSSCDDCTLLWQHYDGRLLAAQSCPLEAGSDCSYAGDYYNRCGCVVPVNQSSPFLAELADARTQLEAAGCMPMGCGAPCAIPMSAICSTDGLDTCIPG